MSREYIELGEFLTPYVQRNFEGNFKPVAVGRYGIKKREEIYSKELAKDYSKNKVIFKNTLTLGMGSVQIDVGILSTDETYSVSPAYHTYKIAEIDSDYLRYCLECRNHDMFKRYVKRGSRQGKTIDRKRWLDYKIPVFDYKQQKEIVIRLSKLQEIVQLKKEKLDVMKSLVRSRFVELFGDPILNTRNWKVAKLNELGVIGRGKSKHRPRNAPELLGGKYPLIQTGDVARADLYINEYNTTYSELGLKQSKMWKQGTLCITIAANIAKTSILNFDACFPDSVVGFVSSGQTSNVFVHHWFSFFQEILENQAPESAQKNINLRILSELNVILPPIEIQKKFIEFVNKISKLKYSVQKSLDETQVLFDSLMQEYFG